MNLAINTTVCIEPNAIPSLQLTRHEYAVVSKVDAARGRITLRRVGGAGSWRQKTIDDDMDGIHVVPALEPTGSRLFARMRELVAFLLDGVIRVGQVSNVQSENDDAIVVHKTAIERPKSVLGSYEEYQLVSGVKA